MRVLVAPDKFKGSATALEVAEAIASACAEAGHEVMMAPMADGGEGTLAALGGANRTSVVSNPLGDPVEARWRLAGRLAVIEMAEASGLALVGGAEGNDPVAASTAGTGELIDSAIQRGARRVIVGVGGTAATDGGYGAVQALHPIQRLRGVELIVACDVRTAFLDAATVYGPQKGATPAQVELLSRRLARLAQVYLDERGVDVTGLVGAGAGGGLPGGLASIGAELVQGFDVVSESIGLYDMIEEADLVITGEGRVDSTSFSGKVVGGIAELAAEAGVPVVAVAGELDSSGCSPPIPVRTLVDAVGRDRALDMTVEAVAEVTSVALAEVMQR